MERASVSAISLRHIIWLPHESHVVVVVVVVAGASIWLRQKSKAHFGFPGYAPGTIAVNVTWTERGFNACQTHYSMCPSIFNRFPVIQPVSSNVRHFNTFLHFFAHFWPPLRTPFGKSL